MASIEETLNRLREDNLKGIEDERIAREKETRARLDLLKDEKSLLREKKINAGKESIELRKQIKEKQKEKQKTGDFKLIATIERLTRELEKAEEAEEAVERETEGDGVLPTARNIGLGAVEQLGGVQRSVQHRARSPQPPTSHYAGAEAYTLAYSGAPPSQTVHKSN